MKACAVLIQMSFSSPQRQEGAFLCAPISYDEWLLVNSMFILFRMFLEKHELMDRSLLQYFCK